jgi:hypothetical protein
MTSGAIIAWRTSATQRDIYGQRVDFPGARVWTTNGVPVVTHLAKQSEPAMIRDGIGGAIIVWEDLRDLGDGRLYTQRKNSAGSDLWVANGKAATNGAFVAEDYGRPRWQATTRAVYIAWNDGINDDLRAQHVDFFKCGVGRPASPSVQSWCRAATRSSRMVRAGRSWRGPTSSRSSTWRCSRSVSTFSAQLSGEQRHQCERRSR